MFTAEALRTRSYSHGQELPTQNVAWRVAVNSHDAKRRAALEPPGTQLEAVFSTGCAASLVRLAPSERTARSV